MGHRELRINLGSLPEATNRFLMIEAVAPDQTTIEPKLGFSRLGRDWSVIGTEIVVFRHLAHHSLELVRVNERQCSQDVVICSPFQTASILRHGNYSMKRTSGRVADQVNL